MDEQLRTLDTNILLRYFLQDVPDQAESARRLIDSELPLGLTVLALAEVAWVLAGRRYQLERPVVAAGLLRLLSRDNIVAVGYEKGEAQAALLACTSPTAAPSFGDALIAACARSAGIHEIYTFDRGFGRSGLVPITPP